MAYPATSIAATLKETANEEVDDKISEDITNTENVDNKENINSEEKSFEEEKQELEKFKQEVSKEISKQKETDAKDSSARQAKTNDSSPIKLEKDFELAKAKEISSKEDKLFKAISRANLVEVDYGAPLKETVSKDGTTIENIEVHWIDEKQNDKDRLSLKWDDNFEKYVRMRLSFALSGQEDYDEGTIQIEIPKHIFKDRNGKPVGNMSLAVPKAPDRNNIFNYIETDTSYILVNTKKISAASQGTVEMTISGLTPSEIKDKSVGYTTDPFNATIEVLTHKNNKISMKSNDIDAEIDTRARITGAYKRHDTFVYEYYPENWPQDIKPEDSDKYVYVKWTSWAFTQANQYFDVEVNEKLDTTGPGKNAKIIGFEVARTGKLYKNDQANFGADKASFSGKILENEYTGSGQNFHSTIYTAYPKENFTNGEEYELKNDIEYKMISSDDKEESKASNSATIPYAPVEYKEPEGHFIVNKQGDGKYHDYVSGKKEGIYSTALNDLEKGKETDITFDIKVVAFGEKWTLGKNEKGENLNPSRKESYNQRPYTLEIEDTDVNFNYGPSLDSNTFEFKSLVVKKPTISSYEIFEETGKGYFENKNGVIDWREIPRGDYGYKTLNDDSQIPDIEVFAKTDKGDYKKYATVSYKNGKAEIKAINGAKAEDDKIIFPENEKITKYKVTSETTLSHVEWKMYPEVTIKPTEDVKKQIAELYKSAILPMTRSSNTVKMRMLQEGEKPLDINTDIGRNQLMGFSHGSQMSKSLSFENDVSNRKLNLKYTAKVRTETNVNTKEALQQAIEDGVFVEQKSGIFYDLLPKGVSPHTNTIKLRDGDKVRSVKLYPNYKDSGRTLMVVEADLTPQYKYNYSATDSFIKAPGYYDEQVLTFDASYSWFSLSDYGDVLDNKIAYESDELDQLGSIKDFKGEPNDPFAGNHNKSKDAIGEDLKDVFTDLSPDGGVTVNKKPVFLYAKSHKNVFADTSTLAHLNKTVDVNKEELYGDGLDNKLAKNVYEGGSYTYNIRLRSSKATKTNEIIFYDNLENYVPTDDKEDFGDVQWRGKFISVDVDPLKNQNINPIVYYSTKKGLVLSDKNNKADLDLTRTDIWSTQIPADKSQITAIAVDARKTTDGSNFVLEEDQEIGFKINMQAPMVEDLAKTGEESLWYDKELAKNEKEAGLTGGAHAYNNISMYGTTRKEDSPINEKQLITHDYVKVGLKPFNIEVEKTWNDYGNRDGLRTDSVTIELHNEKGKVKELILSQDNKWKGVFDNIPYQDETGRVISYTLKEKPVKGYSFSQGRPYITDTGIGYVTQNKHEAERIVISGEKLWKDKNQITRPDSIEVILYKNGESYLTKIVRPDENGNWTFKFDNLFKNENGKPIEYTVKEKYVNGYIAEIDNYTITNKYQPYGDIHLSKEIRNETEDVKKKDPQFEFEFYLIEKIKDDGEAEYLSNRYEYIINKKSDSSEVERGHINSMGGTFKLRASENITIKNVDSDYMYQFKEINIPNGFRYDDLNSSDMENVLQAGEKKEVKAVNIYDTKGNLILEGQKKLEGRDLISGEFIFDVFEKASNRLVSTGRNDINGNINFVPIDYSYKDIGKIYTYIIKEKNLNRPGLTYDANEYEVEVKVEDNGEGEIVASPNYKTRNGQIEFKNTYKAKGEIELKAWKRIFGSSEVKKDQFTFALYDENGKELMKSSNDADGKISFKMNFTEKDAGQTKKFKIQEVKGTDSEIIYDETAVLYEVTVTDNRNGTLSFDTKITDEYTADINNDKSLPIFVNKYKDGSLSIQKEVTKGSKDKLFKFRIRLKGDDRLIPKDGTEFKIKRTTIDGSDGKLNTSNLDSKLNYEKTNSVFSDILSSVASLFTVNVAYASNAGSTQKSLPKYALGKGYIKESNKIIKSGDIADGGITWELYNNYHMVIRPTDGKEGTITSRPWNERENAHNSLSIEPGVKGGESLKMAFTEDGFESSPYDKSSRRKEFIDVTHLDTSKTKDFSQMFWKARHLKEIIGLDKFDTRNATSMYQVFADAHALEVLDLSNFDTRNVTDFMFMLEFMNKLTTLKVGPNTKLHEEAYLGTEADHHPLLDSSIYTKDWTKISGKQKADGSDTWTSDEIMGYEPQDGDYAGVYVREKRIVSLEFDTNPYESSYGGSIFKGQKTFDADQTYKIFNDMLKTVNIYNKTYSYVEDNNYKYGIDYFKVIDKFDVNRLSSKKYNMGDDIRFKDLTDKSKIKTDILLEAQWKKLNYKVSFNMDEGITGTPVNDFYVDSYGVFYIPKVDWKKEVNGIPYELLGFKSSSSYWIHEEGTTYTQYKLDADDLVFEPVWQAKYKVNFNTNGGAGEISPQFYGEYETINSLPSNITKPGYKLKGWTDDLNNGKLYDLTNTDAINIFEPGQEGTLYAVWTPDSDVVKIKDGEFYVELAHNEKVVIENLPAGLSYEVIEMLESPEDDDWVIVEEENTTGNIISNKVQEVKFKNEHNKSLTQQKLVGKKFVNDSTKNAGGYIFGLYDSNRRLIQRVDSMYDGSFNFSNRVYDKPGEYIYYIKEFKGDDRSIIYDDHEEKVVVKVKQEADGRLSSTVEYDNDGIVFNNKTKEKKIKITKNTTGIQNPKANFNIVLLVNDGDALSNGSEEKFTLKAGETKEFTLKYGDTYEVKEVDIPNGYKLVDITNEMGTVRDDDIETTITNHYDPVGSINLKAKKVFQGGQLLSGQFAFELFSKDEKGNEDVIETAYNDGNGMIYFDSIKIDKSGEYTYYIREINNNLEGVVYDEHIEEVKVIASEKDNDSDTETAYLHVEAKYSNEETGAVFTNKTEVPEEEVKDLKISKKVKGINSNDTFELLVSILDENGQAINEMFEWESNKSISAKIKHGEKLKISHDEVITIKGLAKNSLVKVEELEYPGYKLSEESTTEVKIVSEDNKIELTNIYSPEGEIQVKAKKQFVGKDIKDYVFNFVLLDAQNNPVSYAKNDENGDIVFDPIKYTQKDVGTHTYSLLEQKGAEKTIEYDETIHKIVVEVKNVGDKQLDVNIIEGGDQDIVFKNIYRPLMPVTGTGKTVTTLTALVAMIFVGYVISRKTKKEA